MVFRGRKNKGDLHTYSYFIILRTFNTLDIKSFTDVGDTELIEICMYRDKFHGNHIIKASDLKVNKFRIL